MISDIVQAMLARCALWAAPGLVATACGFTPAAVVVDAGGDTADAPCFAASATCVDPMTLQTCAAVGAMPVSATCAWGCEPTDPAHCAVIVPSGGTVVTTDLDPTGLADVTIGPGATINTSNGAITGVSVGYEHELRGAVQVFRLRSLSLTGAVTISGDNAVALVADGAIEIGGVIDARGPCSTRPWAGGPGGSQGAMHDTVVMAQPAARAEVAEVAAGLLSEP